MEASRKSMLDSFQRADEESGRDPDAPTNVASRPDLFLSSDNESLLAPRSDEPSNAWARTMLLGTVMHVVVCKKPRVGVLCQNMKAWRWLSSNLQMCADWKEGRD